MIFSNIFIHLIEQFRSIIESFYNKPLSHFDNEYLEIKNYNEGLIVSLVLHSLIYFRSQL